MSPSTGWPTNHPILRRPRLDALIKEGLKHPLLVMLAAPGYGKTQAMVSYMEKCDAEVSWLHLNSIDNLTERFWIRLLRMLKDRYPAALDKLQEFTFPDNVHAFAVFVQIMEEHICKGQKTIWVFDDYGIIKNQQIKTFVSLLVDANFTNFHLVLLSNVLNSMESIAFMTTRRALLLAEELRFDKSEIRELYRLYGIKLSTDELDTLEWHTEGWAMPLCLLASQHDQLAALTRGNKGLTPRAISHLFEDRFFMSYPERQQKLLMKLSMMDSFTKPFAFSLYNGTAAELELFWNHAFLINEPATERFYLHHLYRVFLQEKLYMLVPEEKYTFWEKAADYHLASGNTLEAVTSYRKSGNHVKMLGAIVYAATSEFGITDKTAAFFLEHLDLLTPEDLEQNPTAENVRALLYLVTYQLDKVETIVLDLEKRLLQTSTPENLAVLGETHVIHGLLYMMRGQENFGLHFKKAAGYLPNGTISSTPGNLKVHNNHSFFMPDNTPRAKERIELAIQNGVPWMSKVMKGAMSGMPQLFSAEAAYLSYRFEEARQHAYRAVYVAKTHAQHDLVLNAHCLLARIGFMQGDYQEITKHIKIITRYTEKYKISVLKEIQDTALGWYFTKMRDFPKIPKSIISTDYINRSFSAYARPMTVFTNYLIGIGEYAQAIGWLDHVKNKRTIDAIDPDIICVNIMLAIGYLCLGHHEPAIEALWTAYDMCYHNGLITLFIEADQYMLSLIAVARQQSKYLFDSEWLNLLEQETTEFIKRADAVRAAYKKQNPTKFVKDNPLSGRELAVLQSVARGLTREEIALEQYISMNTVKSTITNIYNKLGANNKADAVSIAISKGYIDGHTSEYIPKRR